MEPFVKGDKMTRFANLKFEDKRGAPPRIKLVNDDGSIAGEFNARAFSRSFLSVCITVVFLEPLRRSYHPLPHMSKRSFTFKAETWDTDAVEEFLSERLIGEGADAATV